tara:strand:- start:62 stop:640 length:579 start_codon:yes stop_codon:yes gene_type:complete
MGIHGLGDILVSIECGYLAATKFEYLMLVKEFNCTYRLFSAILKCDVETVRHFLRAGISPEVQDSGSGERVLGEAIFTRRLEIAKLARAYGAELVRAHEESLGNTPTPELLQVADADAEEWLLSGPPVGFWHAPPTAPNAPPVSPEAIAAVEEWRHAKAMYRCEQLRDRHGVCAASKYVPECLTGDNAGRFD